MLTGDRDTHMKDGELLVIAVAAATKCFAGGLAVANANGYAAPGSTALNLTYIGRFEETVDNTSGANGDLAVKVRRKKAFKFGNSGGDPVTQASLGKVCYIVDDETVAATDGANTRSPAGVVLGIEADGVWVE